MDGFDVDAEKCLREAGAAAAGAELWKAGTRKEGRVIMDEGDSALVALLGASIVAVLYGGGMQRYNTTTAQCVGRKCAMQTRASTTPALEN